MKKLFYFLLFIIPYLVVGQITTTPTIPTETGAITIHFDATNTGLANYSGDVYAHTGVTYDGSRWQNVIESWGNNTTQPKLTRDGSNPNLYTLQITPDIHTFYGVDSSKKVTELCFVFRSADASLKNGPDLFVSIYEEGLNIAFTNPEKESVFSLNDVASISAEASIASNLELFVNGSSIQTASNSTTITSNYTFLTTGLFTLKATAENGGETNEVIQTVYVKTATQNEAIPTSAKKGINKNADNSVTFVLEAPNKESVFLIGDFNNWQLNESFQLKKDTGNPDLFWITLSGLDIDTEYAFQYYVDYTVKIADPYSEKILDQWTDQYISDSNYPNLKAYPFDLTTGYVSTFKINEPVYSWNVSNFTRPSQDNLVIYELHIRDFTETDSYNEALTKLDYLQSLGINAIELMPINEFEGADSWGYNPALYMALDKAYGTKNKFKEFVDACHQRGIAVIADVVFNHSYGQSPLVQLYWDSANNKPAANNPWYNQNHNFVDNTSAHWGYDFNHESAYTKTFFKDVISYWINEYKIDGFRFDFTKGFSNTLYYGSDNWASAYDASRIAILKDYASHVWSHNPTNKPYVIFEHLSENSEETELANYGILLWGNMNHNYNQNTMGFNSSTDVSWISYKQRGWNNPNVIGYMESHDEERLMYKNLNFGNSNSNYNVRDLNTALKRQELAGMFFFTIPGPKMIWQFGELGYDISIDENGRVGRKPIKWDYYDVVNRKQIYNTWATLIAFKTKYPEVFNTSDYNLNVSGLGKTILLKNTNFDIALVGNFDIVNKTITGNFSKTGTWYEYFSGEELNVTSTSQSITLNPGEYKLYSTVKLVDPRGGTATDDSDGDGVNDDIDQCPNTPQGTTVNETGCPIFSLSANNFSIEATSETCPNKNNGIIAIEAVTVLNYTATLNGTAYPFTTETTISNLAPGVYSLCITVEGESYEQCYSVTIEQGSTVSGKASVNSGKMAIAIDKGTAPFTVFVNNKEQFETYAPEFSVDVFGGDLVQVKTAIDCEGVFEQKAEGIAKLVAYPNPTNGIFEIRIPNQQKNVVVEIYSIIGQLVSSTNYNIINNKIAIDISNKPKGLYIVKAMLQEPVTVKIIKQ